MNASNNDIKSLELRPVYWVKDSTQHGESTVSAPSQTTLVEGGKQLVADIESAFKQWLKELTLEVPVVSGCSLVCLQISSQRFGFNGFDLGGIAEGDEASQSVCFSVHINASGEAKKETPDAIRVSFKTLYYLLDSSFPISFKGSERNIKQQMLPSIKLGPVCSRILLQDSKRAAIPHFSVKRTQHASIRRVANAEKDFSLSATSAFTFSRSQGTKDF